MGFLNEKQVEAMLSGNYICEKCQSVMEFEDEWEDVLVCPKCGFSVESERYGFESDEEYDALYPTMEEVMGYDSEEEFGETYDEVYGELSNE